MELAGCAYPLPVQVLAHEGAAIVAHDDAIGIQHGNYFEDEGVAEEMGLWVFADQEIYHAFHNPAGVGLTRVHAGCENDRFSHTNFEGIAGKVCHYEHVHVVAS